MSSNLLASYFVLKSGGAARGRVLACVNDAGATEWRDVADLIDDSATDLILKDGSEGTPSLRFENDLDTGMYRATVLNDGADGLAFSVGAIQRLKMDSTAVTTSIPMRAPNGSIAAPAYSFTGGEQTGMYLINTDTIGFSTGNSLQVYLDRYQLQLLGGQFQGRFGVAAYTANGTGPTYSFIDERGTGMYRPAANTIGFTTDSILRASISDATLTSTVPFHAPNGSVGAPAYTFENETVTGMYLPTANTIGFSVGGILQAFLDDEQLQLYNGVFRGEFGSASVPIGPTYSFYNDPDTGMYRPTANTIGFSVGGTLQAFLDDEQLQLYNGVFRGEFGTASVTDPNPGPTYSFYNDKDTGMYRSDTNTIGFGAAGVLRASISTSALTSTVPIVAPAGTAGAPSYTFDGDVDTGMFRVGPNVLGIACLASEIVRIDTTGLIMQPNYNLEVTGTGDILVNGSGQILAADYSGTNPSIAFYNDPKTGFLTNASPAVGEIYVRLNDGSNSVTRWLFNGDTDNPGLHAFDAKSALTVGACSYIAGNGSIGFGFDGGAGGSITVSQEGSIGGGYTVSGGVIDCNAHGGILCGYAANNGSLSDTLECYGTIVNGACDQSGRLKLLNTLGFSTQGTILNGYSNGSGSNIEGSNMLGSLISGVALNGGDITSLNGEAVMINGLSSQTGAAVGTFNTCKGVLVNGEANGVSSQIVADAAQGSMVSGYATGSNSKVRVLGNGAIACGYAASAADIVASGDGSQAFGYATTDAAILATNSGSTAFGYATGASATLTSSGLGSFVNGVLGNGGGTTTCTASGEGSGFFGKLVNDQVVSVAGVGSLMVGSYTGTNGLGVQKTSEITNDGNFAVAYTNLAGGVSMTGRGSAHIGYHSGTNSAQVIVGAGSGCLNVGYYGQTSDVTGSPTLSGNGSAVIANLQSSAGGYTVNANGSLLVTAQGVGDDTCTLSGPGCAQIGRGLTTPVQFQNTLLVGRYGTATADIGGFGGDPTVVGALQTTSGIQVCGGTTSTPKNELHLGYTIDDVALGALANESVVISYWSRCNIQSTVGADYAEYFEWNDGNVSDEQRIGYFVSMDATGMIEKTTTATASQCIGVSTSLSAGVGVIGDSADKHWAHKYLRDEFNQIVIEPDYKTPLLEYFIENAETVSLTDEIQAQIDAKESTDATLFDLIDNSVANLTPRTKKVLNPAYDPELPYLSRMMRKEWTPVSLLGKVNVRDDGTCVPGQLCSPNDSGVATPGDKYVVMKRVSASVIRVLIK